MFNNNIKPSVMKDKELNIPGLKPQRVLFDIPEGYEEQLIDKLEAITLSKRRSLNNKGKIMSIYLAVSSSAASILLAVWLFYSSSSTSEKTSLTDNLWTEEDEWVQAFSLGGEYEIIDEDFVDLASMLIEEEEKNQPFSPLNPELWKKK